MARIHAFRAVAPDRSVGLYCAEIATLAQLVEQLFCKQ